MDTKYEILKHYISEDFKPVLPSNHAHRHYRVRLQDGGWRKIPVKIRSADELQKWIVKLGGVDVYYSTSTWMNPQKISKKGGSGTYIVADNLLYDNDLVFDIDAVEPITEETLNEARKSTNNIYEQMKMYEGYEFQYMAWSACKGFRIVYKDNNLKIPSHPRERISYVEENRKIFIGKLLEDINKNKELKQFYKIKTFFDQEITKNAMCVIRLLGSAHRKTGYISTKIVPTTIRTSIKKILDNIPYIGKKRPGIPRKREMTNESEDKLRLPRTRLGLLGKDATGLASFSFPNPKFRFFASNRVLGITKGFIPIFIYEINQKYYVDEIKRLQEKYKLGHLYVFEANNKTIVVSLKTMQKRQLQKVLNASSSKTKHVFKKYKRIYMPFISKFKEKIQGKFTGHLSRGHFFFVEPSNTIKIRNMYVGWSKIEQIIGVLADNR